MTKLKHHLSPSYTLLKLLYLYAMQTSAKGLQLIKDHEGFRSKPYLCPTGVPTIGYGSTFYPGGRKVSLQDKPVSESEATELLAVVLTKFESAVNDLVTATLTQNQFDALVSFVYNIGPGAFTKSTLRRKVNADTSDPTIAAEFAKWVNGGGKKLPGLVRRRADEAKLYFT